jgi:hypothetical protein
LTPFKSDESIEQLFSIAGLKSIELGRDHRIFILFTSKPANFLRNLKEVRRAKTKDKYREITDSQTRN